MSSAVVLQHAGAATAPDLGVEGFSKKNQDMARRAWRWQRCPLEDAIFSHDVNIIFMAQSLYRTDMVSLVETLSMS